MKTYLIAVLMASLAVIAGCATQGAETRADPNYQAYLDGNAKVTTLESSKIDSIALAASACGGDARCVENVAAYAAMAALAASGGHKGTEMYRAQPSIAAQVGLALVGNIAPIATAAVAWHQADANKDTQIAQYQYLGGVLNSSVNGMAAVAIGAKPSITVGGNYGDTHTGDTVGGSQVGHDYVTGQQTNNSGNIGNDNRQGSPGPIGPACTGTTCQGTTPTPTGD